MSDFIIEYSANLDDQIDIAEVVELVRQAAVDTGSFPLGGIRVRAIRCDVYAIADGREGFAFMAMLLRLPDGSDLVARKRAGELIFRQISRALDPLFADDTLALSFDIQEVDHRTSWQRNAIHDLLISEAKHG